jgi:hypothetical protein
MPAVSPPRPRSSRLAWAVAGMVVAAAPPTRSQGGEPKVSPATLARDWKAAVDADDDVSFARIERDYETQRDETLRGLLVTTVCDAVRTEAAFARVKRWRERKENVGPDDAWLWFRSMLREVERAPAAVREEIAARADDPRSEHVRAAVVHALAEWADPETLTLLPDAVRHGPVAPTAARDHVLEAWAHVVGAQPGRARTPEFRAAVQALLGALERFQTSSPTRLVAARWLARAFDVEEASTDLRTWRSLLERVDVADRAAARTVPASASFFDLDAHGDRVVYVLDASGSMDDPIEPSALSAFRRLTPPARLPKDAKKPDWDRVTTLRQAVAEATKMSLRGLEPHVRFCVVLFGSQARPIPSTPTLVAATPQTVAAACLDLDRAKRTHSQGTTNLHGALRQAFSIEVPGDPRAARPPFASALALEGATSIFLLTDGVPSRDDWDDTANLFAGRPLFADAQPIVDDVARMNLLRRCEIGAVSLGTGAQALLDRLARATGGRVRVIGGGGLRPGPAAPAIAGVAPDRSAVPALIARLSEPDDAAATSAESSLSTIARRSFGSPSGLSKPQRTALARNWSWYFATR